MDVAKVTERVVKLEKERDDSTLDADRQTAGMREVALFRAANAAACLGQITRPLLDEVTRCYEALDLLRREYDLAVDGRHGVNRSAIRRVLDHAAIPPIESP